MLHHIDTYLQETSSAVKTIDRFSEIVIEPKKQQELQAIYDQDRRVSPPDQEDSILETRLKMAEYLNHFFMSK